MHIFFATLFPQGLIRGVVGLFLGLVLISLFSCGSQQGARQGKSKNLDKQIKHSPVFNDAFTGFVLYDPRSKQTIYEQNADRYFTAASNTKIFTLYLCATLLGDSIPALQYSIRGDSLIFWGTGDPSFLNPYLPTNNRVFDFLKSRTETLFFSSHNFQDQRFGAGWAWDDYYYDFQAEKSSFPIYSNVIRIKKSAYEQNYQIQPSYFAQQLTDQPQQKTRGARVRRNFDNNQLFYNIKSAGKSSFQADLPWKYSDELFVKLLSDALGKPVQLHNRPEMPPQDSRQLFSVTSQSLYEQMMLPSDNFVAEQLLLLCAQKLTDTLNVAKAIDYAQKELLNDLSRTPRWRDGSGLSRYNLFTPRSVTEVLDRLYTQMPQKELFANFPAGGESGTIKDWYGGNDAPYVFAKTGSMSYVHCLSGYLLTSSGRTLIFSFMHNNFPNSSRPYKQEMEKVLRQIYLNY